MTDETRTITGGCLCGAVRFSVLAEPIITRTCWCRLCQSIGAGSATVNVGFPSETFRVEGALSDYACVAESGSSMHRRFCPVCGTHLFSEAEQRPHLVFIRAGALDDPEIARPAMTIWTSTAPSWACIDPDLPQLDKGAPPPPPQP